MSTSYTKYSSVVYHRPRRTSPSSSQHVGHMRPTSKGLLLDSNNMKNFCYSDSPKVVLPEFSLMDDNRVLEVPTLSTTTATTTSTISATTSATLTGQRSSSVTSTFPSSISSPPTRSYFTWLVFLEAKWVPFDDVNQFKLEQTLTLGGTFVDITDSHFRKVKRVRVFPKSSYLSYLGVKYRLSRIMQPDAWLDHVNLKREARESGNQPSWGSSDE